jgi:hypothetical protein
MIDCEHRLSVVRQCELLALPRSSFYYQPTPAGELDLMRRIDALHLKHPWMGSRSIRDQLKWAGCDQPRSGAPTDAQDGHPRPVPQAAHDDL